MDKPCLVIMAAGMGSRYGGLKQMDPMDEQGHIIMDFSVYDAREAGFEKVVFIIKKEFEDVFRRTIGDRVSRSMEVAYAFQNLNDLPGRIFRSGKSRKALGNRTCAAVRPPCSKRSFRRNQCG